MMPDLSHAWADNADTRVRVLVAILTIVSGLVALVLVPSLLFALALVASGEGIAKLVAIHGVSAWLVLAWIPAALVAAISNIMLGLRAMKQPTDRRLATLLAFTALILAGFPALWHQWT